MIDSNLVYLSACLHYMFHPWFSALRVPLHQFHKIQDCLSAVFKMLSSPNMNRKAGLAWQATVDCG